MAESLTIAAAQVVAYCRAKGYPEPVPEYPFHPDRGWRFDLAFLAQKVAVEFHGAVHRQGRHTRGGGFEEDRCKFNSAVVLGWKVVEVTYRQVAKGLLFDWLDKLLAPTTTPAT